MMVSLQKWLAHFYFAWRVTWNYAYSPFNVWIVGKNIFYKEDTSKNASTQNLIW